MIGRVAPSVRPKPSGPSQNQQANASQWFLKLPFNRVKNHAGPLSRTAMHQLMFRFGQTIKQYLIKLKTMSDHKYMRQGNDVDEPDPFEGEPFTRIEKMENYNSREAVELVIQEANRIYKKLDRDNTIIKDEYVIDAIEHPTGMGRMEPELFYHYVVGPTASTADEIRWNNVYRYDPDGDPGTPEKRREALAEFNIPDDSLHKLVPKAIKDSERVLRETHESDARGMSPRELGRVGNVVYKPENAFGGRVIGYLGRVPWIDPPDKSGPAWEWVADKPAEQTTPAETEDAADA